MDQDDIANFKAYYLQQTFREMSQETDNHNISVKDIGCPIIS
jgi:hypothetical protein